MTALSSIAALLVSRVFSRPIFLSYDGSFVARVARVLYDLFPASGGRRAI